MRMRPDPVARLYRALVADAQRYGLTTSLANSDETPWASATFVGMRIVLQVVVAHGEPGSWLAALPEADLPVPGHCVADCAIVRVEPQSITLEVLLLED